MDGWAAQFEGTRFAGITTDGITRPGLFKLGGSEGAPVGPAVQAARALLEAVTPQQRERLTHPLDSRVWRAWFNPELYINQFGLRLEELDAILRERVLELAAASLSPAGYRRVRDIMATNGFLGELVDLPLVFNEYSYNVNIMGTPSETEPWGWNFWGHHIGVNCLFIGGRQVLTPIFFGAEPNIIDEGEHSGLVVFGEQERAGLAFARSLSEAQAAVAVLYEHKRDPRMPAERRHPGDELHLAGAFHDNRVIPYEGIAARDLDEHQRADLLHLIGLFLDYQPDGPRAARLTDVSRHLDETYFCWIGGTGDAAPFYFRVQSPVILVEFDHHAGVILANPEPEKFHIHTIVRTPNGNDYGAELVREATGMAHLLDGPV